MVVALQSQNLKLCTGYDVMDLKDCIHMTVHMVGCVSQWLAPYREIVSLRRLNDMLCQSFHVNA